MVTVPSSPNGAPIAMTGSPTTTASESPSVRVGRSLRSTLMTARSYSIVDPTTSAMSSSPSLNVTESLPGVAPSTTCWLVRMYPSWEITNPDLEDPPSLVPTSMNTTEGRTWAAVLATDPSGLTWLSTLPGCTWLITAPGWAVRLAIMAPPSAPPANDSAISAAIIPAPSRPRRGEVALSESPVVSGAPRCVAVVYPSLNGGG